MRMNKGVFRLSFPCLQERTFISYSGLALPREMTSLIGRGEQVNEFPSKTLFRLSLQFKNRWKKKKIVLYSLRARRKNTSIGVQAGRVVNEWKKGSIHPAREEQRKNRVVRSREARQDRQTLYPVFEGTGSNETYRPSSINQKGMSK